MSQSEFIDFAAIDAEHIEQIRSILLDGRRLIASLSQIRPAAKVLQYCRQATEDQLVRIREYEDLPFDDRPVGFLDREHEIFYRTCEILVMTLEQRFEVDDSHLFNIGASEGKI